MPDTVRYSLSFGQRIALLALLYVASGWLALKLAIPPGYVTAVFPPAGIALGALLLWGPRVWPGVFLGSVGLNVLVGLLSPTAFSVGSLGLALTIAGGSSLQCLTGYYLISHWLPGAKSLRTSEQVVPMLLLGGPIACLVASTIGSLALVFTGKTHWVSWPFSLWSWWVGDTIGVILFTPLFLVLARVREAQGRRWALTITIPSLSMLALVVILFFQSNNWENQRLEITFHNQALTVAENLKRDLERCRSAVANVRGLYQSAANVSRSEFKRFTAHLANECPGMLAIAYAPQISHSQRLRFEQEARAQGLADFVIRERAPSGQMVPARPRPVYFPVYQLEPLAGNETALGHDLGSETIRLAALTRARQQRMPTATPRITLVNHHQGLLLMDPVFLDQGDKESAFMGVALAAFQIDTILNLALPKGVDPEIHIRLEDNSAGGAGDLLYANQTPPSRYSTLGWSAPLSFANRQLNLRFSPSNVFLDRQRSSLSWLVLAGGLLFTGVLQMLLLVITGHAQGVEQQVATRTRELADSEARFRAVFNDNPDAIIVVNREGLIVSANTRTESLFGYTPTELNQTSLEALLPERFRQQHKHHRQGFFERPQTRAMGAGLALFGRRADGTEFPVDVLISPMHLGDQSLGIAIVRDITERKTQELRLNNALREKDILLKEVYHRVKNNLQVIQSLLNLEARTLPEGMAREAMVTTGTRVGAMALVHEKLYQSGNLASISLESYIRDLLRQLQNSNAIDSKCISVDIDVADIKVGLDAAIPLGLLLNELVSNSIKHGFPRGLCGKIHISLQRRGNGAMLTVADTGIGLPVDLDPHHTSTMGLKLVNSLVLQLGGTLEVQTGPGTCFNIRMPIL